MLDFQDGQTKLIGSTRYVRRGGSWYPDQAAAAPTGNPRPLVSAPPPQPTPQTNAQALGQDLGNRRTSIDIANAPLDAAAKRTTIDSNRNAITNSNIDNEAKLRTEFTGLAPVKEFQSALPKFAAATHARDNPVGDMQVITAWVKAYDPTGSVMTGDVETAEQAQSAFQKLTGQSHALFGGNGRLDPEVRKNFLQETHTRLKAMADAYRHERRNYENIAKRTPGVNPQNVIGDPYQEAFQKDEAAFLGRPVRAFGAPPQSQQSPLDPTGQGDIGFNQDAQQRPSGQQMTAYSAFMAANPKASPDQLRAFGKSIGWDIHNADAILRAREQGAGYQPGSEAVVRPPDISDVRGSKEADAKLAYQQQLASGFPLVGGLVQGYGQLRGPQKADALVRGAVDVPTMGMSEELLSGFDPQGMARQNAIRDYDQQNNFGDRLGGQILGGFALPTGVAGEARSAGTSALRGGLSRAEALQAATRAGATQAGKEGLIYGGAYGAGSTDGGIGQRALGAGAGAATAGALGYGGGRALGSLFGRNGNRRPVRPGVADLPPLIDPATGSLNQPLENASPAARMAAAKQYGIDLPLDSAGNKGSAIIGKGLDILPASAGLMNESRRLTHGQTEQAVSQVADRYGQARTMDEAGRALQTGAKSWIGRFDRVASKVYDAIPIHPAAKATLSNTRDTLSGMLNIFQSNSEMKGIFQNGTLKRYLQALDEQPNVDAEMGQSDPLAGVLRTVGRATEAGAGDLSWQDLKHFRSIIGEQIGDQRFSDSPLKSQMRGLYGALSEDMRQTAAARGPRALQAFERANNFYAQGQNRIEGALVRILGDDSKNSPEAAAAAIQTIARSGRGSSNIQQLNAIRNSLRKGNEWNEVASSLIRLAGQPSNSQGREFDPGTFIRTYADMDESARNLLFGDGGRRDLRKALDGFVAVTQRLQNTNALRNTSQTAPGFIGAGVVATVGQQVASVAAHPIQTLFALTTAAGSAGANYGMAKAWTNPKFVNWATGYSKAMEGGKATEAAQSAWIRRLNAVAKSEPVIANDVLGLQQRLQESLGQNMTRAAASSREEEERRKRQPRY